MGLVHHKVVTNVNIVFRNLITWLMGQHMEVVMSKFKTSVTYPMSIV
jgi:hypothetical protein